MIVPVTTGGNSGNSRLMKGAARMPKDSGSDHRAIDTEQPDIGRRGHR